MEGQPIPDGKYIAQCTADKIEKALREWKVTIEYGTPSGGTSDPNPLARPAVVTYASDERTEPYFMARNKDGNLASVVNTAGERPDGFFERECGTLVITVQKNQDTFDPVAMAAIQYTTNSGTVTIDGKGYAAGTLLLKPPTAQKVTENVTYYQVTYQLKAKAEGWYDSLANVGYSELKGGKPVPILDKTGNRITKPWPLNTDGTKKANQTDTIDEIKFWPYEPKSWGINF